MRHLATLHMIQPPTMPPGVGPTTTCPRAGIGSLEREPDVDPPVVRMRRGHRKIADPAASPLEAKR
jgi:hypothetical protein